MTESSLNFQCALITGGGGGIGKALASYFISQGKKVIIVGRTESTLRETAKEIGATDYYVLDTGVVEKFPEFVSRITTEHPELDCLVNNAGVQRPLDLVDEGAVEDVLGRADQEIDINVRGVMHLTLRLLGHLKKKEQGAVVMNVSSVLAFVPFAVINPVYSGTKAWVHFWSMNLRTQLRKAGWERIRVVEIAPPTVETDLHRERADPDDNKKEKNPGALSLEEFMEEVAVMLERGEEVIAPGMSAELARGWYEQFGGLYDKMTANSEQALAKVSFTASFSYFWVNTSKI